LKKADIAQVVCTGIIVR